MNVFNSTNYPTTEPENPIAGDRWAWKRSNLNGDYQNNLYTLSYEARLEGTGSTVISLTASASESDYVVEVASATTAAYTPGVYHWAAYITRDSDSERIQIDSGTFEVLADKATAITDPRSHVKIVLDAIEATIEGRASLDQMAYSIAGRSLSRTPVQDLLRLKDRYQAMYSAEKRIERRDNGNGTGTQIKVRF